MNRTLRLYTALLAVTICLQANMPAISECDAPVLDASLSPETAVVSEATLEPSPTPECTLFPEVTEIIEALETPSPDETTEAEITPEPTVSPEVSPVPSPEATPAPEISPEPSVTPEPEAAETTEPETSAVPDVMPEATLNPEETPVIAEDDIPAPEEAEEIEETEEEAPRKKRKKPKRDKRIGWKGVVQSDERGMPIPMLFQFDYKKVAYYHRGTPKSVSTSGCGATCVSMIVAYLTGNTQQNPYQLFFDAVEDGYYKGNGLSHEALSHYLSEYGVKGKWIFNDGDAIIKALKEGKPVIAHMGDGIFTENGHYVVLRGVTEDGKILINDPNSRSNCSKAFPIDTLLREARTERSFMVCWVEQPAATASPES